MLFQKIPAAHMLLKLLCGAYLIYLSWKIATAEVPDKGGANGKGAAKPLTFLEAALFQWLNPKAWSMVTAAIALYTPKEPSYVAIFIVCLCLTLAAIPSTTFWALLGTKLSQVLKHKAKRQLFNRVCAGALLATLYPIFFTY